MLLERGVFTTGLPRKASDALKLGLEQAYDEENDRNMKPFEAQVLVPAAATWLLVAGKTIYNHCLNGEIEQYGADIKTCEGWGGGTWTRARWEYWAEQLQEFAGRDDMNDECRAIAAQAVAKMAEIEMQHGSQ